MKTKLKLLLIATIIFMLVIPCNAEIVNIDYEGGLSSGEATITYVGGDLGSGDSRFHLYFSAIEEWVGIKSIIYRIEAFPPPLANWEVRDLDIITTTLPIKYKIGADELSGGEIQVTIYKNPGGGIKDAILLYTFDSILQLNGRSGGHLVTCDYSSIDFNIFVARPTQTHSITDHTNNAPTLINSLVYNTLTSFAEGIAYKENNFHQSFEWDYVTEYEYNIDFEYYRNEIVNKIMVIGNSDISFYDNTEEIDIRFDGIYDLPLSLYVNNPVYTGSGPGEWFNYSVPSEYEATDTSHLTYRVYNAEEPTTIISTLYNLTILNETTELYEPYTTGFNPGIMDINIPNNRYYNMTLERYQFLTKEHYFSVSGDADLTSYMYPDYAGNYTVTFKVREYETGNFIEAVKVTANGEIKYTPYNGNIGFGDIDGLIEYEASKTGYVPISGNKTITSNQAIFITMLTEEQALEDDDEDEDEDEDEDILGAPTNLLESIQYAFQKMFGLSSSTEDMEVANLLMGLGVIFAGAVLIASITKDALGAVVGGLIGFIMALALGFIPLWVVFVGFSAFAIYIILTRTGGSE